MASSSADDVNDFDFITIVCTNPNQLEAETTGEEILISATDILSWDFPTILRFQTVKVRAHRNSESNQDHISVQWNLETFLNILKGIYGLQVDVTPNNFLQFYEGALYFGVQMLLEKCKTWFSEVVSSKVPAQIGLDSLVSIWNFGFDHADDVLPIVCASYLAKNFMWAMRSKLFVNLPYSLLKSCIMHHHLTIESEMNLCVALFTWFDANVEQLEDIHGTNNDCTSILKQIRVSLLPLWFAAGHRSSRFSKLADASIHSIFKLLEVPSTGSINVLGDGDLNGFKIRLTEFSEKVNLSSCPQITTAVLLLSVLPSLSSMEPMLRNTITELSFNPERFNRNHHPLYRGLFQTLSFESVQEVDISMCQRLHLESAIECFSMSFPSLKTLRAAYLLNFDISILHHLVKKCSMVCEVDLSSDISPIVQLPIVTPSPANILQVWNYSSGNALYMSNQPQSNITKLTLEGRSDLQDTEFLYIARFCVSLQYLNFKGCISLTDIGIARLLYRCIKLHSIIACGTAFGINSVEAVCSSCDYGNAVVQFLNSMASNLRTLHIGGCKGVDETCLLKLLLKAHMLKSLCLGDTCIIDHTLFSFTGSSLEVLDVSNTMVTGVVLAHIVCKNPALKCLRVRGCRNLSQQKTNMDRGEIASSYSCGELEIGLSNTCKLEEISLGWGFSYFSMKALKPAITSLRAITVGLGASIGEDGLIQLPITCPTLESVILYFQVISDSIIKNIVATLRNLQVLALCHCLGDISISGFKFSMPNLRKLQLELVTPWMTNNDLVMLTQSCANLIELSLLGCKLLNSDSQHIISRGWPGLISIHLQECGEVTTNGIYSLLDCVALEDVLLRHNGPGIPRNFIHAASSKLPLLRKISLDVCDARDGYFDIPSSVDRNYISIVKITSCKSHKKGSTHLLNRRPIHNETLVAVWNGRSMNRTVLEERL
ncbi:hypothetical protein FNV43_RR18782 [Rhamnella rubrinervis]|uniref:BACK domain-containing protein n=1 Tax=Rhamnella rubrinervis TaxID=2594499 RepID=A0A8K0E4D4_9ROSA|nr:hypothetical protein FNV43_RR18782 [Rhamnella rubrinervis]